MSSRLKTAARARGSCSPCGGFTLIETLVAMSVLSLIVAVILRDVVSLRESAARFSDRSRFILEARSVLADMLANRDLKAGIYHGGPAIARWTVTAAPVDLSRQFATIRPAGSAPPPQPDAPAANAPPVWETQRLIVEVETGGRPLSIETIRLVRAK